jgi:UDP:flavonoid glycosyltransferase YjiC (YdhE family)
MRIAIIATGSRGDVQPYVALGKGLLEAGHAVRVLSHQNFAGLVTPYGLEFAPVESNAQAIAQGDRMRARVEQGNFLLLMAQMAKEAQREACQFAEAGLAACQGMDLLLAGMGGLYIGLALAEKLNLPLLQAYVVPFTPTRDFSSVLTPRLPSPLNRLSHQLTRQMIWQGFRSADTLARREVLGLPRAPFSGPYRSSQLKGIPVLYGFSPSVIPVPSDWGGGTHVTGFWFLDEAEGWTPPPALTDFLAAGPPPVYIGFGSMSNRDPQHTTELIIDALGRANQRAILLSGWGGLHREDLPESIFMIDSIPHSWLFQHVAAVVHHGGASTTAAGLRAGIPSIIVPFFGDQPFWGRRIAELGVGPSPIPRKKLTAERLAGALKQAMADGGMRQRAAELGARVQAEDGVGRAVQIVTNLERQGLPG